MGSDESLIPHASGETNEMELGSISDAQRICGNESRSGIYRAIACGEITAFKRGRRTVVDLESARRRARNFLRIPPKNIEE